MAKSAVSREFRQLFASLDVEIVKERRAKHIVAHLRNRYGVTMVLVFASSTSCHRAAANQISIVRRFAEQKESTHVR